MQNFPIVSSVLSDISRLVDLKLPEIDFQRLIITTPSHIDYFRDAFISIAKKVHDAVYSQRHLIFFSLSTAISCLNSPKLFSCGFAVGFINAFIAERVYRSFQSELDENESFIGAYILPQAAIAQITLGSVTLIAQTFFSQLHYYPFYVGQDGTTSSLLSGFIAGSYAASISSFITGKIISQVTV